MAELPEGSEWVFTFSQPDSSTSGPPVPGSAAARVAAAGEPWRTRFAPGVIEARLRAAGFGSVTFLFSEDVTGLYLDHRQDGLRQPRRVVIADVAGFGSNRP